MAWHAKERVRSIWIHEINPLRRRNRRIRSFSDVPIIVLSVRDRQADKVAALDAGADDYVAKPFAPSELVARVRSVLRRAMPARQSARLQRGDLVLDPAVHTAKLGGRPVELSPAEFEILTALFEAGGRVVTREQLIDRLHPHGEGIDSRSIDVYVRRLRLKLSDSPSHARFVVTARGVGYRLGTG